MSCHYADFVQPLSIDGIVDDRGAAVGFPIQYPADILADYAKKQKIKRVCNREMTIIATVPPGIVPRTA